LPGALRNEDRKSVPDCAGGREQRYPLDLDPPPGGRIELGKYTLNFASTAEELDAIQKLRFDVFNLELGEGLDESFATGRDQDDFDSVCHHLVVTENDSDVVGTYRLQTGAMANANRGFYSADEFTLDDLPAEVIDLGVEVGRAAIAKNSRNRNLLFLVWKGLAVYMAHHRKRFLFGCCSLTSQDPVLGKRVMEHLERTGHVHPTCRVRPQDGWECYSEGFSPDESSAAQPVDIPRLFSLYLRYGAKVCGVPAIDRLFKTIDYLVLLDVEQLDEQTRRMYFE
jgi:putative hemolysin